MSLEVLTEGSATQASNGIPDLVTETATAEPTSRFFQIISGAVGFGIDSQPSVFPASIQKLPGKLRLERPTLAANQRLSLCLEIEEVDNNDLRLRVEGSSPIGEEVAIESVEVFSAIFPGRELELTAFGEQSWSEAHAKVPFDPDKLKLPYPVKNSVPPQEGVVICPGAAQISIDGGRPLFFGFLGAREQQGMISIEKSKTGFKVTASVMTEKNRVNASVPKN